VPLEILDKSKKVSLTAGEKLFKDVLSSDDDEYYP